MLSTAIDFWVLPATLFRRVLPGAEAAPKTIPLTPAAQRIRRRHKIIKSKRGN